tara:strand:+ start:762 stop:1547 length:786 start_codon:yes stop_codon:yes gene_type:complete
MQYLTYCLIGIIVILLLLHISNIAIAINDVESLTSTTIVEKPDKINNELKNFPAFIINFSHRKDRALSISKVMNKMGFKHITFVEPVSRQEILRDYPHGIHHISTLSRLLTTIKIFNMTSSDKFFVFEDDVDVYTSSCSMNDIYNAAQKIDYDLIFFEICYTLCHFSERISDFLYLLSQPYCNGAMLYTQKFVKKFFNYIKNIDITKYACDSLIIQMNKENLIRCVGYPYFRQNPTLGSEIETSMRYKAKHIYFDPLCRFS